MADLQRKLSWRGESCRAQTCLKPPFDGNFAQCLRQVVWPTRDTLDAGNRSLLHENGNRTYYQKPPSHPGAPARIRIQLSFPRIGRGFDRSALEDVRLKFLLHA